MHTAITRSITISSVRTQTPTLLHSTSPLSTIPLKLKPTRLPRKLHAQNNNNNNNNNPPITLVTTPQRSLITTRPTPPHSQHPTESLLPPVISPLPFQTTTTTTPTIRILRRAFATTPPPRRRLGWLSSRVAKLRLWGSRGTKAEDRWDPWDSKARDLDIGSRNTDLILQNAQASRQRQLEQIDKYKKKAADKEASVRTPLAYAAQKRAEKVPLPKRIGSAWAWLKNPRNYLGQFYKDHNLAELSFTQKCMYVYWRRTLAVCTAFILLLPQFPVVRDMIDELTRHRDRKRRGVLGLDEYCHPEKQFVKLTFLRTNDWTFDTHYLQKMILRDLYVLTNVTNAMSDITAERQYYIAQMLAKLVAFEQQDANHDVRQLNPTQRDAILNLTQYHTNMTKELEQSQELSKMIDEWQNQVKNARDSCDVQITTLIATYLHSHHAQDRTLERLTEQQKSIQEWREALEEEYNRHLERMEEIEEFAGQLIGKGLVDYETFLQTRNQSLSSTLPPSLSTPFDQLKTLAARYSSKDTTTTTTTDDALANQVPNILKEVLGFGPHRKRVYPGLARGPQTAQRFARGRHNPAELEALLSDTATPTASTTASKPTRYSPEELERLMSQAKSEQGRNNSATFSPSETYLMNQQLGDYSATYQSQFAQLDKIENNRLNASRARI